MFKVFVLICLMVSLQLKAEVKVITLGMLPGGNPQIVEKESFILAEKLQNKIGIPVQVYISKNYMGLVDAIKNKKVDLAILSAMTYVMVEKETQVKVLLKKTWNKGGAFYYSSIITKKDSPINSAKDLKNKRMVFVDEKSTSGYLYPQVFLKKQSILDKDFKSVLFSGNHAASIDMLESGKADAAAVFSDDENGKIGAWTRFSKNKKNKFKVIWLSDPIPNDPIVVRQDFYDENPKITHEIMYNLIEIQSENNNLLTEALGSSALMPATSKQYEPVREMLKTLQINFKL